MWGQLISSGGNDPWIRSMCHWTGSESSSVSHCWKDVHSVA